PIKAIASSTHVLMLTTLSDWESKTQALRDGASDFLLKSSPLVIPDHIRLALRARPDNGNAVDVPVKVLCSDRRAPESNGRPAAEVARSHPPGCRKRSWRRSSSRLVRGVHYLRSLLAWGGWRTKLTPVDSAPATEERQSAFEA